MEGIARAIFVALFLVIFVIAAAIEFWYIAAIIIGVITLVKTQKSELALGAAILSAIILFTCNLFMDNSHSSKTSSSSPGIFAQLRKQLKKEDDDESIEEVAEEVIHYLKRLTELHEKYAGRNEREMEEADRKELEFINNRMNELEGREEELKKYIDSHKEQLISQEEVRQREGKSDVNQKQNYQQQTQRQQSNNSATGQKPSGIHWIKDNATGVWM